MDIVFLRGLGPRVCSKHPPPLFSPTGSKTNKFTGNNKANTQYKKWVKNNIKKLLKLHALKQKTSNLSHKQISPQSGPGCRFDFDG